MNKTYQEKVKYWAKRRKRIYEEYKAGKSQNQIARDENISLTRVREILQKYELELLKNR